MEEKNKGSNTSLFLGLSIGIIIGIILSFVGMCFFASAFGFKASDTKEAVKAEDNQIYSNNVANAEEKNKEESNDNKNEAVTAITEISTTAEEAETEVTTINNENAIPKSPVKVYEWEENRIYDTDHQASYKGKLYRAKWNNIGNKPDESGEYGVWELLDDNYER